MIAYQAIFRNGRLYDLATDQRILLKQEARVLLVIDSENDLNPVDINIVERPALSPEEQANNILAEDKQARKIFDRGTPLYFTINAGIREQGRHEKRSFRFKLQLVEDIWLTRKGSKTPEKGVFAPCLCVVCEGQLEPIGKFEPVYADSLNNAYRKVYDLYFSMYGSGSSNVYDKMETEDGKLLESFRAW